MLSSECAVFNVSTNTEVIWETVLQVKRPSQQYQSTEEKKYATKTKDNPEKTSNTKYSKTKLAWFSRLIRSSARKQGGLILQRSRETTPYCYGKSSVRVCLSVTLRNRGHIGWNFWNTSKITSWHAFFSLQTPTSRIYFKRNTLKIWPE